MPGGDAAAARRGEAYEVSPEVGGAADTKPYDRKATDPLGRQLRILALDPAASVLDGAVATIRVPYEPLEPAADGRGFRGCVFEVDHRDHALGIEYQALDLDDHAVLLDCGREPSPADPLFHQQMVYAVCARVYATFRRALGRTPTWRFTPRNGDPTARLQLRPFGAHEDNAWYDRDGGNLVFGYFDAPPDVEGRTVPGGPVFTSLAHDIVTHELTHALLDGLRGDFMEPTNPDVFAFHEAFADLMAVFHRFGYPAVVEAAMAQARGQVDTSALLTNIAEQFGQALGGKALRSAIEPPGTAAPRRYDPTLEAHDLGTVLVSAVFEAFTTLVKRRCARYVGLATGGTQVLPPGELPAGLRRMLATEASKVAAQFCDICIRAIDYCPPVDITFGEFLRAVLTADHQLVHDDHWGYREAWIDAFRRRRILPYGVKFLSLDALVWRGPEPPPPPIERLAFANLRFNGDPARAADRGELDAQARALGDVLTRPENLDCFGVARSGDPRLRGDPVELPRIRSIRTARRIGPDGQILFDLVAEVTQRRQVQRGGIEFDFLGGATIIIGPDGRVRYLVSKSVLHAERLEKQAAFLASEPAKALWHVRAGRWVPSPASLRTLHRARRSSAPR